MKKFKYQRRFLKKHKLNKNWYKKNPK